MFDTAAFGALVRRKRGALKITQETLALDVFGDSSRKGDISRIENAKVTPQEATVQKLCAVLNISDAEMLPIRQSRPSAAQLDDIPTLRREELENLSLRFGVDDPYDKGDEELRGILTDKAQEYRALKQQIAALPEHVTQIMQIKAESEKAAEAMDFQKVEDLLTSADIADSALAAKTKITRANNALLRNDPEQAFRILSVVADSFGSVDPLAPAQLRAQLFKLLYDHGLRYGGPGMRLASDMIRAAVPLISKDDHASLWSGIQNNLAVTLSEQGTRTGGTEGADLLADAVTTYRAALSVYTNKDHPARWAATQNNLGAALSEQGSRTAGIEGADLLAQAVTAYRAALSVYTKDDHPVDWAMTQNNLGIALANQATRTVGAKGADLLAQAVTAYRAALTVHTKEDHPVDWAMTQNNLGIALSDQGTRTSGAEGVDLLAQAVDAYRAALTVYTKDDHPVNWAKTLENLAITLKTVAEHDTTADPRAALTTALEHVEAALMVYDPDHMPYDHGTATELREGIRAALDALP